MTRELIPLWVLLSFGSALVLSTTAWAGRRTRHDRLAPYLPGNEISVRTGTTSVRQALAPLVEEVGDLAARLTGVAEPALRRLERIGSRESVGDLRARQATWSVGAFLGAALLVGASGPPLPIAVVLLVAPPAIAFLVPEQQLSSASAHRQARLSTELPVVAEQLGMLLGAGWSMGGALGRIAGRGSGAAADDIRRVCARIHQGLDEQTALEEWADLADVDGLHRLVTVLALQREAADLGRLISEEARAMRRDANRELLALIDRRSQQVWIPVTVATLVPGLAFLAVPFIEALRLFTTG